MQQLVRITPFALPELVSLIVQYLGFRDKISCLLVCRQWHDFFKDHVFGEQVLHKSDATNPARLEAIGRYIRELRAYFMIGDQDMEVVATHCPALLTLDVEMDEKATDMNVELFMERMSIQHLVLRPRLAWDLDTRLASITRLKQIESLELRAHYKSSLYMRVGRVITCLQAMPTLSSLILNINLQYERGTGDPYYPPPSLPNQLPSVFLTDAASSSSTPGEHVTIAPTRSTFLARLKRAFTKPAEYPVGSLLAAQVQEPWRTFIPRVYTSEQLERLTTRSVPESYSLHYKPLDLVTTIPGLTTLHLLQDATVSFATVAHVLFPLLPNLRELVLEFGARRDGSSRGLAAVIPSCPHLASLTIRQLDGRSPPPWWPPTPQDTDSSRIQEVVMSFFAKLPSTLRELTLENICIEDEPNKHGDVLALVPAETRGRLRKLVLDSLYHRQTSVHHFLAACQSLDELRLAEYICLQSRHHDAHGQVIPFVKRSPFYYSKKEMNGRSDQFVGSILEPWACTWTLGYVDLEGFPIVEEEAAAAWLDRLVTMPRLTKLALSIHQLRLMLEVRRCQGGVSSTASSSSMNELRLQHVWQLRLSMTRVTLPPPGLYLAQLPPGEGTLEVDELVEALEMMPLVSSLRYVGNIYPLQDEAARWLETNRPQLKVLHVLQ